MSGSGADGWRRVTAALGLGLLVPLTACAGPDDAPPASASATPAESGEETPASPAPSPTASRGVTVPRDVLADVRATLKKRARAIRSGRPAAFTGTLATIDSAFVEAQRQYWSNLSQLPLAEVTYTLDPTSVVRTGDRFDAVVDLHLQLDGFDRQPALSRTRMSFVRAKRGMRIKAVRTGGERFAGGAQPWDVGAIEVRRTQGVLGIFDAQTASQAPAVLRSVRRGVAQVSPYVPSTDALSRGVVVYVLSDLAFMQSLDDALGEKAAAIDGLTFTIAGIDGGVAASRFALNPVVLREAARERDRLVRHELVHVATGPLGPDVPLWLSEGAAEWVSVQAMAPAARTLSRAAVESAADGLDRLPRNSELNGDRSRAMYGISWWICAYIARTYGDGAVWILMGQFQNEGADFEDADLLRRTLGVGPAQIARGAERLILDQFGPKPKKEPSKGPSGSESPEPSLSPSSKASPNPGPRSDRDGGSADD